MSVVTLSFPPFVSTTKEEDREIKRRDCIDFRILDTLAEFYKISVRIIFTSLDHSFARLSVCMFVLTVSSVTTLTPEGSQLFLYQQIQIFLWNFVSKAGIFCVSVILEIVGT